MARYPDKPQTWKPTDTVGDIPDVGKIECHSEYVKSEDEGSKMWSDVYHKWIERQRTHWNVTLTYEGKTITSEYNQGSAYNAPPTAEIVASSLVMDANYGEDLFEEFCENLGYDSDSMKAHKIWEACRDTELRLRRMFGDKYEALKEWGMEQ